MLYTSHLPHQIINKIGGDSSNQIKIFAVTGASEESIILMLIFLAVPLFISLFIKKKILYLNKKLLFFNYLVDDKIFYSF